MIKIIKCDAGHKKKLFSINFKLLEGSQQFFYFSYVLIIFSLLWKLEKMKKFSIKFEKNIIIINKFNVNN